MKNLALAMQHALDEAWKYQLLTFPNPAVGAVCLSKEGAILSVGAHKRSGGPHAEVYALRDAYTILSGDTAIAHSDDSEFIHNYLQQNHNNLFHTISMAVTLEPCAHSGKTPSCAMLIRDLGIKKLFIACHDVNPIAANGKNILENAGIECIFDVMQAEGAKLLEPFLQWQKREFVFFKWAQRLDGTIDNGTISSQSSRKHVHALRDVCDLIVIGGATVRKDRPTLDARLINGRAPDVLIYSSRTDFDSTVPLFSVANRNVFIESSLERIKMYSLVMIEGGDSMMEATKEVSDYYLCYIAPAIGGGSYSMGSVTEVFEVLSARISDNILLWMRKKQEI